MTTDALAEALFKKPTLQDCSLQQVDYLAHQYPYFSTAQLLLLQKSEADADAHPKQLQRTALHFSNPFQLHFLLQPDLLNTTEPQPQLFQTPIPAEPETPEAVTAPEAPVEEPIIEAAEPVEPMEPQSQEEEVIAPDAPAEFTDAQPDAALSQPAQPEQEIPPLTISTEAPAITFEPYHTVDYFASQGIKLSQQEAGNDKLGKQLKSFTEWLKTMKRLPEVATALPASDASGEHNVAHLAAHSLDTADIVTESMAEVWLKQGNKQKAADVYNKLSLRYPGKSAYFAAKIDALKQS